MNVSVWFEAHHSEEAKSTWWYRINLDANELSGLTLLVLSAAFDTVDHTTKLK